MYTNVEKNGIRATEIQKLISQERISKQEAATILSVTVGTITNFVKRGTLKQIKLGTKKQSPVYFKRDEVLKLLDFELKASPFTR